MTSRGRQWLVFKLDWGQNSDQFSITEGQLHVCVWNYLVMIHYMKAIGSRNWRQLCLLFLFLQTSITWNKCVFISFINVLRGMGLTKHEYHAWNLQRSDSCSNWRLWMCRWTSWSRCHISCRAVLLCRHWLQTATCWDTSPVNCAGSAASTSYPWPPTGSTSCHLVSP